MSIKEAIPILHDMYNYYNDVDVDVDAYIGFDKEDNSAIETALDTMRKYQKIEEVVNTWRHDITAGDYHCMAEVAEVIEDGNDRV